MILILWIFMLCGCTSHKAPPQSEVNHVTLSHVELPQRIVSTNKGLRRMGPALWQAHAKRFSNIKKYAITIKKGDTVYSLSRKHKTPIRSIIIHNHLHAPFGLKEGNTLFLQNPRMHKVQQGETIYGIAKLHHMDVKALVKANGLKAPYTLKKGQQLLLTTPLALLEEQTPLEKKKTRPLRQKNLKKGGPAPHRPKKAQKQKRKKVYRVHKKRTSSTFLKPLHGKVISHFGPHKNGTRNDGINIKAPLGTPVKAAENGTVVYTGNEISSYGNLVLIKHSDQWVSTYSHLKSISVTRGQSIQRGQTIGSVGKTGHVKSPQLHFELRKGKWPVNPTPYLTG